MENPERSGGLRTAQAGLKGSAAGPRDQGRPNNSVAARQGGARRRPQAARASWGNRISASCYDFAEINPGKETGL